MTSLVFVWVSAVDDRTAVDDVIVVTVQDTDKLQQANEWDGINRDGQWSDSNNLKAILILV